MRPGAFFSGFQIKVMLLFVVVAIMPLGIVGLFSIRTAQEVIIANIANQLENVANDKAALLERWISERKADIAVIAGSEILKTMDPARIAPYLKLVGENYKVYNGFVVVSRGGAIIFNSTGEPMDKMRTELCRQSMSGKVFISGVSLDPERKESVFHISAPILGSAGEIKGAVCATVGTGAISSIILKVSLGKTGECYLVDKDGTFLAHREPRRILSENIAQSQSFKNIFGGEYRKATYTDYRGIEVLGTSRKVAGTEWYLVVEQDQDEFFKSADRLKRYVVTVICFSLAGAILLASLFSFYIVNPIRTLSEAAEALAKGEFGGTPMKTARTDEIGALYNAFGDMAVQLKARQHSLEEKMGITEAELKETDLKLKKSELSALRSAQLAALGRLAAGVTHEIRTPLTSLKLFLESVRSEIEISPDHEEDYEIAMNQIKRIEATINRFLDFARPQEPVLSAIDVPQLIEEALLVVKPRANQQETYVSVSMDGRLPKIKGDKKQLGEALLNLMVNALEAMTSRGKLTVKAYPDKCEIGGVHLDCVHIDVTDTGQGIEEENVSKLFDPFFTTKASGAGLGLAIVHSTVRSHRGKVRVESVVGEGTTFSIFLPISERIT